MAGREGTGKTKIALAAARAVATGVSLFGQESKQGKILYLNLDRMHRGDIADRLRELSEGEEIGDWVNQITWYEGDLDILAQYHHEGSPVFDDNGAVLIKHELTKLMANYKLVVIDTLHKLATSSSLSEDSADDMDRLLIPIRDMARDTGAAILLLHHTPVTVMRGLTGEDNQVEVRGRGSGAIGATIDHTLLLSGTILERLIINVGKTRIDRVHIYPIVISDEIALTPTTVQEGAPVGPWRAILGESVHNLEGIELQQRIWRRTFTAWMRLNGEFVDQNIRCAHRSSVLTLLNNNRGALGHIRDYYVERHRLEIETGRDPVFFFTLNLENPWE